MSMSVSKVHPLVSPLPDCPQSPQSKTDSRKSGDVTAERCRPICRRQRRGGGCRGARLRSQAAGDSVWDQDMAFLSVIFWMLGCVQVLFLHSFFPLSVFCFLLLGWIFNKNKFSTYLTVRCPWTKKRVFLGEMFDQETGVYSMLCGILNQVKPCGPCEGQFRGLFGVDQQWEFSQFSQPKLGNWGPVGCSRPLDGATTICGFRTWPFIVTN